MLVKYETLTIFGKLFTDKNSKPGSKSIRPLLRAFRYILSPCDKTLLNVVVDQSISGIFWAVKTADKLVKAHSFPLDSTLKSSSFVKSRAHGKLASAIQNLVSSPLT